MKLVKQMIKLKYGFAILFFAVPSTAFAASTLNEIETAALNLLNSTIPTLIAMAVVFFLWSVFKYINSGDNEETRTQARALMVYGIIAIFVMVSLWGFVELLSGTFNLDGNVPVNFNDIILEM